MRTMTIAEYRAALQSQGVPIEEVKVICPRCKTEQCANDLIDAGAGNSFDDVQGYIGYSCVGRFDTSKGCNWTLGGLFQLHELEVITEDGKAHPRFMPVGV